MGGRSDSGGGVAAVFGFLLLLGLVIKYIWWIVGAIAVGAAVYGLVVWLQRVEREREAADELAREREKDLQIRADRQMRWELMGDSRGVYGPDGAAAMRRVADDDVVELDDDDRAIATIARTPAELAALRTERPHQWRWALFASILLQRRESLLPRLRDSELGLVCPTAVRISTAQLLADRLYSLVDQMLFTLRQIDAFIAAPSFMGAFGVGDGDPDADAIEHIANRLMDYHLRLLELSEEYADGVRAVRVLGRVAGLRPHPASTARGLPRVHRRVRRTGRRVSAVPGRRDRRRPSRGYRTRAQTRRRTADTTDASIGPDQLTMSPVVRGRPGQPTMRSAISPTQV